MCNAWIGFAVFLVIKVVEPVGRIWDEEEDGPEADALFTVIILGEEPVNKEATCSYVLTINTTDTKQYTDHPTVLLLRSRREVYHQKHYTELARSSLLTQA
jgi:hypothetical protein